MGNYEYQFSPPLGEVTMSLEKYDELKTTQIIMTRYLFEKGLVDDMSKWATGNGFNWGNVGETFRE